MNTGLSVYETQALVANRMGAEWLMFPQMPDTIPVLWWFTGGAALARYDTHDMVVLGVVQ